MDVDLENILKDSEWIPKESITSTKWIKVKSYYVYLSPPKLQYKINDKLIDTMNKYNAIYKLGKEKFVPSITLSKISKIFKIFDKSGLILYGYTNMSILRYIKSNLQRYLRGIASPFDSFSNIKDIKIQLITVIHGADKTELNTIKTQLKNKHLNRDIEEYIKIYDDSITKYNLPQKTAYIYLFYDPKQNKNYVGASTTSISDKSKKLIIDYVIKKHQNIKRTRGTLYELTLLCKIKYSTKIGLNIIIDKYINKHNTVDEGYNKNFRYVHKLHRKVKEQINKDICDELNMEYDK